MSVFWRNTRLLRRAQLSFLPRRYSYIILIPEIGEDLSEKEGGLFTPDGLVEFNTFTIEKCISAIGKQSFFVEEGVKSIELNEKIEDVFKNLLIPIEHLQTPLELTWGIAKTLYLGNCSMMPTKSYLSIYERANLGRLSKYQSKFIYDAVTKALNSKDSHTEEESRILKKYELEGRLQGLTFEGNMKGKFERCRLDANHEMSQYLKKNEVGLRQYSHTITNPEVVKDFPNKLLKNMASDINEPTRGPWRVSHSPSVYESFLEYCPNKTLRYNAWYAYITVGSNLGDRSIVTSLNLEKMRTFRRHMSNALGYNTYADLCMTTKMAGTKENVKNILDLLLERSKLAQDIEIEKLEDFAKENGLMDNLDHCDIPYWAREQKRFLYSYDEEELRDYFPLPVVLQGLFELCSKLFNIKIVERTKVSVWHEDVKFYDIFDAKHADPIAGFYFDPYARQDEKIILGNDSGWMIPIRNKNMTYKFPPLVSLIFNFQVPMYGKPSLLNFREVKSLFFRFGHALRPLLCETNYSDVSGLSNVEWDAVHIPGHLLINWLYEPHVLRAISSHYSTQESLPDDIVNNFDSVRRHMAGYSLCKELYASALDMEIYSTKLYWRDIIKNLWPKHFTLPCHKDDSHLCNSPRIVSHEGAAAYYSYLWSQMLAADIYSAFQEVSNDEKKILEVGRRFRETFLASGGASPSSEIFRRFRGRDPSHKALLHQLGLRKNNPLTN